MHQSEKPLSDIFHTAINALEWAPACVIVAGVSTVCPNPNIGEWMFLASGSAAVGSVLASFVLFWDCGAEYLMDRWAGRER